MKINWTLCIGYIIILAAIVLLARYGGQSGAVSYTGIALIVVLFVWRRIYYAILWLWLRKNGIETTAMLINSYSTGTRINRNPVMRLNLQIQGIDGTTWQAAVRKTFYPEDMYKLQPGTPFNVYYDPENKSKVVLA